MPPERNNTVRFSQLSALTQASLTDIIPIVDTSIPTLVNKKITITGLNQSLPLYTDMTNVKSISSNWNSVYSSFNANSSEYENTFSNIIANSAKWDSSYTTVQNNSSAWTGVTTYSTVKSLSDTWNTGYSLANSAYTSLSALSSNTWVLKAGDQLTGGLTTTKTNTATFALDELVTKRYVDATAVATQISGNFVPSLYYTKNDFQTGVPVISSVISQFNQATVGVAGSLWSGNISLAPNQFGTDVPAFLFSTANPSAGNRAGIYIDGGSAGQFSFSQGAVGHNWNGPNFATVYNLTRAGTSRLSIYDDVNLNNNLNILGNASTSNLVFDNWRSVLCKSVLALSGSVTTIGDRLALSGNRLAFESGNTQKFYIGPTAANGIIAWANNIGGFNTLDVYNSADWQFARSGSATHILRAGGSFETRAYGNGLTIDDGTGTRGAILFESAETVGLRNSTNSQNLRIYNTYTNATNYERLSLSATRIAYEYAGTGVSRDLTIQSTGNLILSAGGSLQFSQSLPTSFAGLQATAPGSPSSSYFKVLSSNNLTLFNINSAGRVAIRGRSSSVTEDQMNFPSRELELVGFTQPILFRHSGSNTGFIVDEFSHGLYSDSGGCYIGSSGSNTRVYVVGGGINLGFQNTGMMAINGIGKVRIGRGIIDSSTTTAVPAPSAHVQIITDSSYNSHVSDMLLLSAGPNVSISNYINCLSADRTIFSINSAGQYNTANIAANRVSINSGSGNILAIESTDGNIIGTNNSGGSYSFVSVNNYAANAGPSNPALNTARGQWNFPSVINAPTAFTLNNQMYLLNYTPTTDLIAVSSTRSTNGFYFYTTGTGSPRDASIYLDTSSYLNIQVGFGNGKQVNFTGDGVTPFSVNFPSNGIITTGNGIFNAYNTATNNVTINQTAGQYGTLLRVLSTNSTAMFSVSADGVSRFNNKVFIKPTGLIQFTNESTTTPAIKGTSTTVQARTGDDSQYTYLQGKLQTDQAASAGTFTPDKYIILYDSTGTAYKVPVQAL